MTLYNEITLHENLYRGWARVDSNDGSPGVDNVTLDEFALSLEGNLSKLEKELSTFTYQPQPLIRYDIPKPNGKIRVLAVPTVRDRVAQASALIVLRPVIEREFEKCSFAFRPGLSRFTAIDEIHKLRDDGYLWIVDADIESFFDNVDHSTLLNRLQELVKDNEVIALIDNWIKSDVMYHGVLNRRDKGLPQGAVISPILANLYLDKFDEELLKQGLKLVRFADDFVILCKSRPKAEEALKLSEAALNELELHLNREKTKVTTFDEGFKYLGALFIKDLILPTKMHGDTPSAAGSLSNAQSQSGLKQTEHEINQRSASSGKEDVEKSNWQSSAVNEESKVRNLDIDTSLWQKTIVGSALLKALNTKGITAEEFLKSQSVPNTREALQEESDSRPAPAALQPPEPSEGPDERETIPVAEELPSSTNASPFMRTLYIQEQGCWLRIEGEKFVITTGGKETIQLLQILAIKVEQILIFGACIITPAAMRYCLTHNIPFILLSSRGEYFGRIESTINANIELERLQFIRSMDEDFMLDFSRRVVEAKLYNTRSLLQRAHQKARKVIFTEAVEQLARLIPSLRDAKTVDEIRGYEGRGSAIYFGVFDELFSDAKTQGFQFTKRVKHPPTDPVNAMLSFGYSLLFNNIFSMVRLHNLNPYVGFFHSDKPNHPSLVSDLIEEFRCIIEGMVVGVINRRVVTPKDFYSPESGVSDTDQNAENSERPRGCFLTNEARKKFVREFELLMRRETTHPSTGYTVSYRRCLDLQVQNFVLYLRGERPYVSFTRR